MVHNVTFSVFTAGVDTWILTFKVDTSFIDTALGTTFTLVSATSERITNVGICAAALSFSVDGFTDSVGSTRVWIANVS